MRQVAAHGAAVANLVVTDVRQRLRHQWTSVAHGGRALSSPLAYERTETELPAGRGTDATEWPVQAVDVNQVCGARQAQIEQRDQTLTARQHFGVVAEAGQQLESLGFRVRTVIVERGRFHVSRSSLCHGG